MATETRAVAFSWTRWPRAGAGFLGIVVLNVKTGFWTTREAGSPWTATITGALRLWLMPAEMNSPRAIQRYVGVRHTRARGLRLVPRSRGAIVSYGLFNYPALFAALQEVSFRSHQAILKRLKWSAHARMLSECEEELITKLELPFAQTIFRRIMARRQFGELVSRGPWRGVESWIDSYFRESFTSSTSALDDALDLAQRAQREGDIRFGLDILKARFEERKNRLPPLFRQECAQRIAELTALLER